MDDCEKLIAELQMVLQVQQEQQRHQLPMSSCQNVSVTNVNEAFRFVSYNICRVFLCKLRTMKFQRG